MLYFLTVFGFLEQQELLFQAIVLLIIVSLIILFFQSQLGNKMLIPLICMQWIQFMQLR